MPCGAPTFCLFLLRNRTLTGIWRKWRNSGEAAAPGIRGKGYGEQMLRLAVKYAFEIAGLQSVALHVFDCNTPAIGLYKKTGFQETAVTPECFAFRDEVWGRCKMEITVN